MKTIELFCGTKSFSNVASRLDHSTLTLDNDVTMNPDLCVDILGYTPDGYSYDLLWASPPCQSFSVASIGKNWFEGKPKSQSALQGLSILDKTIEIISSTRPKIWFIENPRGMMRKVIDPIFTKYNITDYRRVTITYCQYGDTRMKPTDIWTNHKDWTPRPMCKYGDKCHVPAPRGSKTGTQGLKDKRER